MAVYQIKKEDSHALRSIVMSQPFYAEEKPIQYGIQYTLDCGVKCNIHYSEKNPSILKAHLQSKESNKEIADLLEFHISTISIQN